MKLRLIEWPLVSGKLGFKLVEICSVTVRRHVRL
jgi:hypothetical protein